jgi:phosphatidylglycerophosphate synthase
LVGIIGALMIGAGFVLCSKNINWLWLSIAGFVVNWYGDSLDGTLARVRNTQRPLYGYYLDHTVDCFNEAFMFLGLGLSYLMRLDIALMILIVYLFLTVNVSVNAHLKSEFKLTYGKLGPTEFRVIACLLIMCVIFFPCIREFHTSMHFLGREVALTALDIAGLVILAVLVLIYLVTVIQDARGYAKADPMPERRDD